MDFPLAAMINLPKVVPIIGDLAAEADYKCPLKFYEEVFIDLTALSGLLWFY